MKSFFLFFMLLVWLQITIAQETTNITILHTNDCHGHILPFDVPNQQQVGGMSPRLTYIKQVRQEMKKKKSQLLILDAGDYNTGDPFSDMLKGEPGIKAMNLMGYDTMVLGNHEFDLHLEDLKKQAEIATFPYISGNVVYKDTGEYIFPPYIVVTKGNIKIGIIGMTTDDTPMISTYGYDPRLLFIKHEEALPKLIAELRPQVDFLIGLFHISHEQVLGLAKSFSGLDMVIGGHTHMVTPEPVIIKGTIIVEAGSYGLLMGRFDLQFNGKKLKSWKHKNVAMNLTSPLFERNGNGIACYPYKSLALDAEMEDLLNPYKAQVDDLLNEPLGEATKNFTKGSRSSMPSSSSLGNLITDALKKYTNADIALHNAGGIRSDLLEGKITYRDVKCILPFANTLYLYEVTGNELLEILNVIANADPTAGRYFEVSGIQFTIAKNQVSNILVNDKPINQNDTYKLATNSFIARGGDGFTIFDELVNKRDTGFSLADILATYIKENKIISPNSKNRFRWKN